MHLMTEQKNNVNKDSSNVAAQVCFKHKVHNIMHELDKPKKT
jgi:hypothetical protein